MWRKCLKGFLFPPFWVLCLITPLAIGLLVYAFLGLGTGHPLSYVAYVLSAYALTLWCMRAPSLVRELPAFVQNSPVAVSLREKRGGYYHIVRVTPYLFQVAYIGLLATLGFQHKSFWYLSLGVYYLILLLLRLGLSTYEKHKVGDNTPEERRAVRRCGYTLLGLNGALTLIIFFMVYWGRTFYHNQVVTIALAAYTFTTLTLAILRAIRHTKEGMSPLTLAKDMVKLAASAVALLTLEATMLTTFGGEMAEGSRRLMLLFSGIAVAAFILVIACLTISAGKKNRKTGE